MEKKIRIYPKTLYKIRLTYIRGAAPNNIKINHYTFRVGDRHKRYFVDIIKDEGYNIAKDMRFIHRAYYLNGHRNQPLQSKFWKIKLLWNKIDDFESMQNICKTYNIEYSIYKKKKRTVIDVVYRPALKKI